MTAVDKLLALAKESNPFGVERTLLERLQIEAMNERFQLQRGRLRALARRAEEAGIDAIRSRDDMVPLLFSHAVYKSYPETLVAQGRWTQLLHWFSTLSTLPMDGVDLTGVEDIDDWVARLYAAGHRVFATSGTGGKHSFLDQSDADIERTGEVIRYIAGWPKPLGAKNDRVVAILTSRTGPNNATYLFQNYVKHFAAPGKDFAVEEPLLLAHVTKLQKMKKAMASGEASPEEIAAFEVESEMRGKRMRDAIDNVVDAVLKHRHEPQIIKGLWARAWQILETARSRGIPDGDFHPDTFTEFGGGLKGVKLPPDYREQVRRFFAPGRNTMNYGMAEMSTTCPKGPDGNYHVWPWNILFILDESGRNALPIDQGPVTGRAAFFDLIPEGRWGGIISGDRVTATFGAHEPMLSDEIIRYSELTGGDDKLTCSATIESYIRGIAEEA